MIIAVDFDGILCEDKYPEIGRPLYNTIYYIKSLKSKGNIIILWTCRCGKYLKDAVEWCRSFDLDFDYINQNTPENIKKYNEDSRKIFADLYFDDRNANILINNLLIYKDEKHTYYIIKDEEVT